MSAIFSPCGLYRYRLERHGLSGAGAIAWIMVNPSTADAKTDDHTIRKVVGFTERLGGGWAIVGNLFAYRATDVSELRGVADPVGPDNYNHLRMIMGEAATVIVAWGPLAKQPKPLRGTFEAVVHLAEHHGRKLHCLGAAKDGHPLHPLTLGYDRQLVEWRAP